MTILAMPNLRSDPSRKPSASTDPTAPLTVTIALTVNTDTVDDDLRQALQALQSAVATITTTVNHRGGHPPTTTPPHRARSLPVLHRSPASSHSTSYSAIATVAPAAPTTPAVPEQSEYPDPTRIRIVPHERSVWRGTDEITLTRMEFDLLLFLAQRPHRVFNRVQLLNAVWGHTHVSTRTVDVHVRRLRSKIETVSPLMTTIRGVGYRLDADIDVARRGPDRG